MIDAGSEQRISAVGELRDELRAMTGVEPLGKFDMLAAELPLLHRCNDPDRLLLDSHLMPGKGSKHREDLGLGGCTFFWVGRCAYDRARLVLIWAPEAEHAPQPGYGAPWDTGGLLTKGTVGNGLTLERAREIIARYSLPVGDYRDYLSLVLETCFDQPGDYLGDGSRQPRWYPACRPPPIQDADPAARTFEVRRVGNVEVAHELVAVVPDETAFEGTPGLLRKLERHLTRLGAEWVKPRTGERPHLTATRFVADFLRRRGMS